MEKISKLLKNYKLLNFSLINLVVYFNTMAQSNLLAPCDTVSTSLFEKEKYIIKEIRFNSFFFNALEKFNSNELLTKINLSTTNQNLLKENEVFTEERYNNLRNWLAKEIDRKSLLGHQGFSFISPHILSCERDSLLIEFKIRCIILPNPGIAGFSSIGLSKSFEFPGVSFKKNKTKRNIDTTSFNQRNTFQLIPYLGYNYSRGIFLGLNTSTPLKFIKNGILNKFNLNSNFSTSSAFVDASLVGNAKSYKHILFDFLEWRVGYRYSNVNSTLLQLKEFTFLGQFFGTTKPVGNTVFRYGASAEIGNKATNLVTTDLPDYYLPTSNYGAAKFYIGSSSSWNRHAFKLSYGLQLGNTGQNIKPNYLKHIFDVAYHVSFLPIDHKPIQIDAQFTSGLLSTRNRQVPAGERFFGGNVEKEFIQGDAWRIRSDPYIRSFSQNNFSNLNSGVPIGGSGFTSINLTISQPVYNKQLVPDQLSHNSDVGGALGGQLINFRKKLKGDKSDELSFEKDSVIQVLLALNDPKIKNLKTISLEILSTIESYTLAIKNDHQTNEEALAYESLILNEVIGYSKKIKRDFPELVDPNNTASLELSDDSDIDDTDAIKYNIETIVEGFGQGIPAYITGITSGIRILKKFMVKRGLNSEWHILNNSCQELSKIQKAISRKDKKLVPSLAEKDANETITSSTKIIGILFKEVNIYSISPVLMLDAARLKINDSNPFRYGVGIGLRVSIVNVNIQAGYSLNINRQIGERPGAFNFAFDISNIF